VHFAFQTMVGIGSILMGLSAWVIWRTWKKQSLTDNRLLTLLIIAAGPLSIVALEAGWVVTEVGRQPWIVHNIMRTSEAVTESPGVIPLFMVTVSIYAVLAVGTIVTLKHLSRTPLPEHADVS
ncbi:MAG: cytochrome ubiquinol oxidase subunit I, partial [Planctomycetaceae bacterium]